MLHRYRWLVAVLCGVSVLALGVMVDVLPRWRAITDSSQELVKLMAKVAALPAQSTVVQHREVMKNKNDLLPELAAFAAQQHVTVTRLTQSVNGQVHMAVHGYYDNMLLFISQLQQRYHASLSAFTYQSIGNNQLRLIMDLTLFRGSGLVALPLMQPHNPFCGQAGNGADFSMHEKNNLVSLDLQHSNLSDTLRMLAKMLGRSILVSSGVEGSVTLQVQGAKPASVFDLLLDTYGLEVVRRDTLWYVAPRDELIKRRQQEMKWRHLSDQAAALVTETWQIRYGKAQDIASILQNGKVSLLSSRGQVRVDARTNVICVQDVEERISVIRQLIRKLDQPAQQVRIEARLASVDSDYEHELGVDFAVQASGGNNVVPGRYSIAVARLPDASQLDIKLAALETKGHAELISSPSLYTASQQPAVIESGEEVPYQEVSESGGTAVAFKKAVLSLKVTPQVLPGGYVLLQLHINQDRPGSRMVLGMPTISTRQILTSVLVKSGQTAVLGGIYENQDENAVQRIPLISSVPVLGELFTLRASRQIKRQLLIFVTPTLMAQPI